MYGVQKNTKAGFTRTLHTTVTVYRSVNLPSFENIYAVTVGLEKSRFLHLNIEHFMLRKARLTCYSFELEAIFTLNDEHIVITDFALNHFTQKYIVFDAEFKVGVLL